MLRWYGLVGIIMVLFAEVNFVLKIQPFANWYFPIIWLGYIFIIDAVVFKLKKRSLLMNRMHIFFISVILSSAIWWVFEFINFSSQNWSYSGLGMFGSKAEILAFGFLSFATVLPAVFETYDLITALHLFDKYKLHKMHKLTHTFLYAMIGAGLVSLILPMLLPKYFFPLIWVSFFFLLDPINYLHGEPSIIKHLKDRKLIIPLSLALAGLTVGVFWEFWNYWAIPKWSYNVPFVGFFKIFEMPILGYLGYIPFAWELYAMYNFAMLLVKEVEKDFFKLRKTTNKLLQAL